MPAPSGAALAAALGAVAVGAVSALLLYRTTASRECRVLPEPTPEQLHEPLRVFHAPDDPEGLLQVAATMSQASLKAGA